MSDQSALEIMKAIWARWVVQRSATATPL